MAQQIFEDAGARVQPALYAIIAKIVDGRDPHDRFSWRDRYCAGMRTRVLHGPEDYMEIDPTYRLWLWSTDVRSGVAQLDLTPSRWLVGAE